MSFQERAKRHLTLYKENSLFILESGLWKKNNRSYAHILPEEMKDLNLLSFYRKELSDYIHARNIHLHQDFHHLNSSQAACLNFFFPMLKENRIDLLLELLELNQEEAVTVKFEKIVSQREATNFDFYIELNTGRKIFFEIKFTEAGFGKVSDLPKYRKKYKEIYQYTLEGKIRRDVDTYSALISNYQLLRNISYVDANRNDLLIVICPEANTKLRNEFDIVINEIVDPHLHNKIRFLTWEWMLSEILKKLELTKSYDRFNEHYTQFANKYIFD
ncbi:PGN_0703 family putative restriction endonuclease [Paenibacillus sp. tmac-D7]|uniref:PGN_0703 family putative restriction endonuclease n=1 Tax=Paenibacillus sp. tmac-D7 TaxID=2591462 RepID=UPI001141EC0F|nr:hypothetical protein [Paenibacillus sp. tmac-D7]